MGQKMWLPRRIVQFVLFFLGGKWLAVGFLRCPFAVPFISCMNCPLVDCPGRWLQPFYIAGIAILAFFTGRGFCGWVCPMGFVQEGLGALPKPAATRNRSAFDKVDKWLKLLKWPALAFLLWAYFHFNLGPGRPFPYVVRSPDYLSTHPLRVAASLGYKAYVVRYVIFAVAIIGALFVTRFWCRYLCPLGAILGLINRVSLFKLGIIPDKCQRCYSCVEVCPTNTTPSSLDCTWCMDCLAECPTRAISAVDRLKRLARRPDEVPEEPPEPPARPAEEDLELL